MSTMAVSRRVAAALSISMVAACSSPDPSNDASDLPETNPAGEASTAQQALLDVGTKETVVTGIVSAENLAFSSGGRLFVTGDSGIYEVVRTTSRVLTANLLQAGGTYRFGGMAEVGGVLYVNAYTAEFKSTIFAARLTATPAFAPIHQLQGSGLANGAAADSRGRLYVTNTLGGTILRLTLDPSDPLKISKEEVWLSTPLPNGIKFLGTNAYLTDGLTVKRIPVRADGTPGAATALITQLTFFDDLSVEPSGILVTDFLFGALKLFTVGGRPTVNTNVGVFNGPSAAVFARGRLGFAAGDVLVTEKGANLVSVYHPAL